MKIQKILTTLLVFVLIPLADVWAHKVILFAWVQDGMILTESSFGGKRTAKDCAVNVFDENGTLVHTGRTDMDGKHAFRIPDPVDSGLVLTLDAGTGHRAEWKLSKDELKAGVHPGDEKGTLEKKEDLAANPSVFNIMAGILIIFVLAFSMRMVKKKKASND
jgi:nickel transport protein